MTGNAWLIVAGPNGARADDGTHQPAGTALNRIVWDGVADYPPPSGCVLIRDDGRQIYEPQPTQ